MGEEVGESIVAHWPGSLGPSGPWNPRLSSTVYTPLSTTPLLRFTEWSWSETPRVPGPFLVTVVYFICTLLSGHRFGMDCFPV